jgi:hypothetical protein
LSFEDGKEFPFAVTHVEIVEPDSAIREIEGLGCSAALAVDPERADHFCVPIVVFICHTVPPIQ